MVESKELSFFLITFLGSIILYYSFNTNPQQYYNNNNNLSSSSSSLVLQTLSEQLIKPSISEQTLKLSSKIDIKWLEDERTSRLNFLLHPFNTYTKPRQYQPESKNNFEKPLPDQEISVDGTLKSKSESYQSSDIEKERVKKFQEAVNQYKLKHSELVETGKNLAVCKIGHGFGNLLQSMGSCLMFGVLTGRAILFGPQDFYRTAGNWKNFFSQFQYYFKEESIKFLSTEEQLSRAESGNAKFLRGSAMLSHCDSLQNTLSKYNENEILDLEGPEGWDYWMDLLQQNPHTQFLNSFPQSAYSILYDTLLPTHNDIRDEIDQFKSKYFGKYTIGIQVRTHMSVDVLKHGIIPFEFYLQVAEQLTQEAPVDPDQVVWFIACVDVKRIQKAQNDYGSHRKIIYYDGEMSRSAEGNRIGFITTLLLSECDDLIVSELSTYGTNGAARGGKKPIVCHYDRICWRHETAEPCHYTPMPLKIHCKNDQIVPYYNNYPGTVRTCAYFYWRSVFKGKYTWPDYYGALNYSTDGSALGK